MKKKRKTWLVSVRQKKRLKASTILMQWAALGLFVCLTIDNQSHEVFTWLQWLFELALTVSIIMYFTARNKFMNDFGYVTVRIRSEKLENGMQDFLFPVNAVPNASDHINVYDGEGMTTLKIIRKRYQMDGDTLKHIYYECLV